MDVVERIKSELSSAPVVLFMKGTPDFPQCGFSAQTVAALRACNAQFKHINIFEEPEMREWRLQRCIRSGGPLRWGCSAAGQMCTRYRE